MKTWFWRRAPDADGTVNRAETMKAVATTAKAAAVVEAQSVEGEQEKQRLVERLESNHFRDKVELALFGRELR